MPSGSPVRMLSSGRAVAISVASPASCVPHRPSAHRLRARVARPPAPLRCTTGPERRWPAVPPDRARLAPKWRPPCAGQVPPAPDVAGRPSHGHCDRGRRTPRRPAQERSSWGQGEVQLRCRRGQLLGRDGPVLSFPVVKEVSKTSARSWRPPPPPASRTARAETSLPPRGRHHQDPAGRKRSACPPSQAQGPRSGSCLLGPTLGGPTQGVGRSPTSGRGQPCAGQLRHQRPRRPGWRPATARGPGRRR